MSAARENGAHAGGEAVGVGRDVAEDPDGRPVTDESRVSAPAAPATGTASILAIGSELLGTTRLDTNSLYLTGRLEALGIRVVRKACVGDGWSELLAEIPPRARPRPAPRA